MQTAPATNPTQPASLPAVIYDNWQPCKAADYTQRFAETRGNLLNVSWLEARIPALFRTTALHERTARFLRFGGERPYDPYILEMIIEMLMENRDGPLNVLEIGAGTTWGLGSEWGAPWFARSLQLAFGSRIQVTASDLRTLPTQSSTTSLTFYTLFGSPLLEFMACPDSGSTRHSSWDTQTNTFAPVNQQPSPGTPGFSAFENLYVRPNHDAFVERALFGLRYVSGPAYDYFDLSSSAIPDTPFDFVFGRMLLPMDELGTRYLRSSVESVLAEGGAYFIHVDRQPPLVGP